MPAHPTFYAKRELFAQFGTYDERFACAADYELMLRFLHTHGVKSSYIDELLVVMRYGGTSNKSVANILSANWNALKAMRANGIRLPLLSFLLKPTRKIAQYFCKTEYFMLPSQYPAEVYTPEDVFRPAALSPLEKKTTFA